jgi:hypothetical protein
MTAYKARIYFSWLYLVEVTLTTFYMEMKNKMEIEKLTKKIKTYIKRRISSLYVVESASVPTSAHSRYDFNLS